MTRNSKVLLVGFLALVAVSDRPQIFAFLAPLANHFKSDAAPIIILVGFITFAISLLLDPAPKNKMFYNLLLPIIFAFLFSLFPIMSEFDPNNISKGFGIIYFMMACVGSAVGTQTGLFVGRNIWK